MNALIGRSARPYLTTQTDLPIRYEAGGVVGKARKLDINSNTRATAPLYTLKDDLDR